MKKVWLIILSLSLFLAEFTIVAKANELESGVYSIVSALDENKAIDINGSSAENCAKTQLWEKNHSLAQVFYITHNNDETYTIESACSGKVLDVPNARKEVETPIWQYENNETDAQKWYVKPTNDGYFYIVSKLGNLCLDVKHSSTADGTPIWTYEPNCTEAQKFKFEIPYLENVVVEKNITCTADCTISDNKLLVQYDRLKTLLNSTPWVSDWSMDEVKSAVEEAYLCFSIFDNESGEQIGFLRIKKTSPSVLYFCQFVIDKNYRRAGIGTAVFDKLFKTKELTNYTLTCIASEDSMNIFKRFGFKNLTSNYLVKFKELK